MSNIVIAVPTMGTIRTELVSWLLQQNRSTYITNQVSPHSAARNKIVESFLNTDGTHLFMVDSDTIPPEDALDKLLELDVPIATGITPIIKGNKPYANVYIHAGDVEYPYPIANTPMGIFEVVGCGASCLLIRRDVLEKMEKPWFKSLEFDNGAVCSEDLFFCEKAIQAGFTITAHSGVRCGHAKTIIV